MSSKALDGKFLLGLGIALVSLGGIADTSWTKTGSGDWMDETGWDNGLPDDGGKASITIKDAKTYVTLSDAATQTVKGLEISGIESESSGANVTVKNGELDLTDKSTVSYGSLVVGQGGKVVTATGVSMSTRGRILVDGGTFVATNNVGAISANTSAWKSGEQCYFRIASGEAYFGRQKGSADEKNFVLMMPNSNYGYGFQMTGGYANVLGWGKDYNGFMGDGNANSSQILTLSGDSSMVVSNANVALGRGVSSLSGNSRLTIYNSGDCNSLKVSPYYSGGGKESSLILADNSKLSFYGSNFSVGNARVQSGASTCNLTVSGGVHSFSIRTFWGANMGRSTVTLSGGHVTTAGYGLQIASAPNNASASSFFSTGRVDVCGGVLYNKAEACHQTSAMKGLWGLFVGNGMQMTKSWYDATLNITSGVLTNGPAPFVVGAGQAIGAVNLSGGEIYAQADKQRQFTIDRDPLAIGMHGGEGSFTQTGGTAYFETPVAIASATTNTLGRLSDAGAPADCDRKAVGTLTVAGGSFTTEQGMTVGADGAGTINLADSGSITVGGTLVLSNAVSSAVNVTLTGTAAPTLTAKKLVVADGAKLTVDVSAFEGEPGYYKILGCTTRMGEFEDVELVGDTKGGKIVQGHGSDPSIYYCIPKGLMLILR